MNKEKFLNKYAPDYNHIVSTYENCKIYLDFVDDDNFALPDNLTDLSVIIFKNTYYIIYMNILMFQNVFTKHILVLNIFLYLVLLYL